ncbi:P-loop containing nucleoside triphosphate hydrolase protein [Zopfochytrium polystomum]|nr:P-loop containing nucleoside triphosphate hydrolase protein [Zopfochytrium polystomum]
MTVGGGGSSFNFQPGAAEFVPSANANEFVPQGGGYGGYPQQGYGYQQQGFQQQGYQQGYQQQGYGRGYNQQGFGYQQQQYYGGGYNNNAYGGGYGRGGYNQGHNAGYQQQQWQQGNYYPQQHQEHQQQEAPQQRAYQAPGKSTTLAAVNQTGPAKSISLGGAGGAKSISIGAGGAAAGPAKSISIGGGPAKSISIGGGGAAGPAKSISIGSGTASTGGAKSISIGSSGSASTASGKSTSTNAAAKEKKDESPQSSPKKDTKKEVKKKDEKDDSKVSETVPAAEVEEDLPPVDEKNDTSKDHLNIVFIGHVDAGKSTMGGHILFLTGMVDKRTMEKYEKEAKELGRESWYLSWALDLNQEERNKGKTVEYGRGYFETEKRRFTVLDAPGHKNYVPSMMQAAAQADVVILVISARKGEFETGFEKGGQTREHAMLAKTVGVKRLIMVVNKMDDPTVKWDKARYDECVSKILPFLKGVGYKPKVDLDVMPISGFTGANLKDRLSKDVCPWYDGPSLLELLDEINIGDRQINGPLLMPISDKFKDMGTVVSGKIESGRVRKGQTVLIMPNKKLTEISTIWLEENEVESAQCGDNVRIRLKNAEEEDVLPGFVMCTRKRPVHSVSAFEARLVLVETKNIIAAGYTAVCHAHTAVEEVTLGALLHKIDKKTGKRSAKPPNFVKEGDVCIARIECMQPMCLETYEEVPQLSRFNLRDEGKTIAVGKITKLILDA